MPPSAEELIAAAERSAQATAAHDRSRWLGLFTDDGCVEDPVGSGAVRAGGTSSSSNKRCLTAGCATIYETAGGAS